ncbi:MAG: phosphoribosylaminoimidazolesuccinocarboxamide synthase [Bacteroidia bacterium]|nr:phosphoribosylaminoimidazolesuccinocarboxamide synthase [Bacteroidota bacterium]MCZ2129650.1 phosphoribosylaminoimidazolesuccinocarboxamide synthase [Bacteroidia bacterium]
MAAEFDTELMATNFFFRHQSSFFRGKVRDVYTLANKYIILVACDRISAFDNVLPRAIPYKGQILTQISSLFLDKCSDIVPTWKIATPDPNVTIGYKCDAIPVEMVVRGYLCGHAWRIYKSGKRVICGEKLPEGLKENDKLPQPIITPTFKNHAGHDEDITMEDILDHKLCTKKQLETMAEASLKLYERGTQLAAERGLILVDTKYEFGIYDKKVMLIDEVHTPDSSRFFYLDSYAKAQKEGKPQKQLSKEFVREWLMQNGFCGEKGQLVPEMTSEFIQSVTDRYVEMYETFTQSKFAPRDYNNIQNQIEKSINNAIESLEF